jgi:hypothetical protein
VGCHVGRRLQIDILDKTMNVQGNQFVTDDHERL